jgi:D-lactate dehydrogenase (cytochrome)
LTTDVCVPISRLADCIGETVADIAASGLVAPLVGHVGDGNFHLVLLADPGDEAENERARAFSARLVERAIRMEGTCTGEHGIGHGKRKYMRIEHDAGALDVMRAIKRALDPDGILNPGKILPDD